ncbi:cytidine deaminase-like protein [Saccharata proteae CBS 121410]|uniref:Cytidine deaminase-like protein n=1 Tax=Saccharata proteae CBS 121410 TaxID=1314787 RepID=A0A9P4HM42_9PEZI|nr:cytidine deaminase-like protein [Saccharata proteae CBS 121410]
MATTRTTDQTTTTTTKETIFPPRPPPPTPSQISTNILACLDVQRRAVTQHKRPFAAILIGPDNTTPLLTHFSMSSVSHAESSLARLASQHFTPSYLWTCTLYSTWEPCCMCTATIYWAHIGRIVYAASNESLKTLTGEGNPENFTMEWKCRDVLAGCPQKDVQVWGPLGEWEGVVVEESDAYWRRTRERLIGGGNEGGE